MEAEGRSYSELYRNSSEEMFLKTLMESSIGMPAPAMESLGLKNISQNFRADSEELFNTWLMNAESNGSIAHRTRQSSRRLSAELAALGSQENGGAIQIKQSDSNSIQQNISIAEESESDHNQQSVRNAIYKGLQASNLFLAKAWFHSSQPMTRSRSSELRRRYVAMQSWQMSDLNPTTRIAYQNISNIDTTTQNGFCDAIMNDISNQIPTPIPATSPASSPFDPPPIAGLDTVSSVVSMLKGTLERKKLNNQTEKDVLDQDVSYGYYGAAQEVVTNMSSNSQSATQIHDSLLNYDSYAQLNDFTKLQAVDESVLGVDQIQGFAALGNHPIQISGVSQEPSQCESSAVAPVLSNGFEICDGPASSGQNFSVCENVMGQFVSGGSEQETKANGFRERIFENTINDDRKKGNLVRFGSVTSAPSVYKTDPTKKRRVERSRKMAEAKERNMTPAAASDAQAILKRCENLEKEVRSLKLNLAFMNRKDSEQTKQIEELQKQNKEMGDEKERLLEEIERILYETGQM